MSMMARFVAITPDQLAAIKNATETVASVFALDAGKPSESPSHARERLRFQAPRLVADMLRRLPPEVREPLRRRLGLNENMRPGPGSNTALLFTTCAARARSATGETGARGRRPRHLDRQGLAWTALPVVRSARAVRRAARPGRVRRA